MEKSFQGQTSSNFTSSENQRMKNEKEKKNALKHEIYYFSSLVNPSTCSKVNVDVVYSVYSDIQQIITFFLFLNISTYHTISRVYTSFIVVSS